MLENTPKNPDIDMSDEYAALIPGAKQYPYKVHGFNIDNVLLGLKPNLVQLVKNNPSNYLGVVVLSNDFKDRSRVAGAIKTIMEAEGLGSHQRFPLSMPWTNLIPNVTPELRPTALSREVMHGLYEEQHYCFYFIDITFTQPPFLVLTYWKLADGTEPADVKAALLDKFLSDAWVLDAAKDHTYLPNETKPEVLFRTILEFASFRTFDYFLDAFPWHSPNGRLMSCSVCHSVDHYCQECTITTSDDYLLRRGTHPDLPSAWNTSSKLSTP
ncbi:hypothetical protein B0H10DRAFT_2249806 [Mycena sp. CBHHK59/15]|nr:hypothetical protein B0H10DRAFT_2249806 [Mycena sp. CBHHK59/15]